MKNNDTLYLRHILDAIQEIEQYLQGVSSLIAFSSDGMRFNAVVRQLEVIGEASAHLSDVLRMRNPSIPWEDIIGMRNRLIHEYFGIDEEIVWRVCGEELQTLRHAIEKILQDTQL
jgi:uncharacterized protein with HEPN domain